jgi:hypothetical protein
MILLKYIFNKLDAGIDSHGSGYDPEAGVILWTQ